MFQVAFDGGTIFKTWSRTTKLFLRSILLELLLHYNHFKDYENFKNMNFSYGSKVQHLGDLDDDPCFRKKNTFRRLILKLTIENRNLFEFKHKLYQSIPLNALFPSMCLLFVEEGIINPIEV